jgi:hypothetical protein
METIGKLQSEDPSGSVDVSSLDDALADFAREHEIRTKGALCVPLVVTDHARALGLPLDPAALRTEKDGQVLGLGKGRVQQILARHDVTRVLAEEGGRTSRGSLGKMNAYVGLLNRLYADDPDLDLEAVEVFWITRVKAFFAAKPFVMRTEAGGGLHLPFQQVFDLAEARQKETPGATILGTVLQHMVGARLSGFRTDLRHHSASTKDEGQDRPGDFQLGDVAVHVSTAPGEALIRKCQLNLDGGQRPVIITLGRGIALARGLADNAGIGGRLDVWDAVQWLAAGVVEAGGDSPAGRGQALAALLARYNEVIGAVETDPSLRIELSTGRL